MMGSGMGFVRRALFVLALILMVIGGLQSVFQSFTINLTRSIVEMDFVMRLMGLVAFVFGALLLIAAWKRVIGLRPLMVVLGWIMFAAGAVILIAPGAWRELAYSVFLNRGAGTQSFMLSLSGLIRIVIGALILYGLSRAPQSIGSRQ